MSKKNFVIKFQAQVSKVTTLSDGGLRIVLDLSEKEIEVARQMMEAKQLGAVLEIAAVPVFAQKISVENINGWGN